MDELRSAQAKALLQARYARVCLIGTGHIGGSLVLALKQAGALGQVVGYDLDPSRALQARALGMIDEVASSARAAARGASLVLLAVPVRAVGSVVREISQVLSPIALVSDVGSTKVGVLQEIERSLAFPGRFVGAHPLAGLERSGPDASDVRLFRGRIAFLTPTAVTLPEALAAASALWTVAGARPCIVEPARHDELMAEVSHLPHVVAWALVSSVASRGAEVHGFAAGGFRDTTRIAASDPAMWRDIFLENRSRVLESVDHFSHHLGRLRTLIAQGDPVPLEAELARLREERTKILT